MHWFMCLFGGHGLLLELFVSISRAIIHLWWSTCVLRHQPLWDARGDELLLQGHHLRDIVGHPRSHSREHDAFQLIRTNWKTEH